MAQETIGQYQGQNYFVGQNTPVMTPDQAFGNQQLPVPQSTAPSAGDTLMASVQPTVDSIAQSITTAPTATETKQQGILDSLASLTEQDTGKRQYELQQEQAQGVPDLQKQISDLTGQINVGNAEYQKLNADYNQKFANLGGNESVETKAVLAAQQAGLTRAADAAKASKAADVALLAARQQALNGNLQTALQLAQNATDARYAPIEDSIKVKQAQLQAIQPMLDKEQRTQALAQQTFLQRQQQEIADKKEQAKTNVQLALTSGVKTNFVNQNGTFFNAATGEAYATPQEFFKAANVSSFDEAYKKGLITDLSAEAVNNIDFAKQAQAKYPDVAIPLNATPQQVAQIVRTSGIYRDQIRPPVSAGGGGGNLGVLGLTNQQIDNISPLVSQFQSSPIVQNYNTIGEGYNFVKSLSDKTTNPADDQALIYALAKALDPGSVVREGEYATVQKYAQSWAKAYGKGVSQALAGTGFLSESARKNIKSTIESRFNASQTSYQNLYTETSRRINLIGNTDKGNLLLNNYGGAFISASGQQTSTQTIPAGTDGTDYGLSGYISDGIQWVLKGQ